MQLPDGALLVTISADVQNKYVAVLVMGWTELFEGWALEFDQIDGDPRDPATLRSLIDNAHALHYLHRSGEVPVHLVGIDSQFLSDYVDAAVMYGNRLRGHRWCFSTAGIGGRGATGDPLLIQSHDVRDVRGARGRRPLLLNTDGLKDELAAHLRVETPGPGYVHIPKRLATTLIPQLTSEERRDKLDPDGLIVGFEWKRKGDQRNEGLDTACIALALAHKVSKRQWLDLLVARHGAEAGTERWQRRFPGERLAPAPPPRPREPWIQRTR